MEQYNELSNIEHKFIKFGFAGKGYNKKYYYRFLNFAKKNSEHISQDAIYILLNILDSHLRDDYRKKIIIDLYKKIHKFRDDISIILHGLYDTAACYSTPIEEHHINTMLHPDILEIFFVPTYPFILFILKHFKTLDQFKVIYRCSGNSAYELFKLTLKHCQNISLIKEIYVYLSQMGLNIDNSFKELILIPNTNEVLDFILSIFDTQIFIDTYDTMTKITENGKDIPSNDTNIQYCLYTTDLSPYLIYKYEEIKGVEIIFYKKCHYSNSYYYKIHILNKLIKYEARHIQQIIKLNVIENIICDDLSHISNETVNYLNQNIIYNSYKFRYIYGHIIDNIKTTDIGIWDRVFESLLMINLKTIYIDILYDIIKKKVCGFMNIDTHIETYPIHWFNNINSYLWFKSKISSELLRLKLLEGIDALLDNVCYNDKLELFKIIMADMKQLNITLTDFDLVDDLFRSAINNRNYYIIKTLARDHINLVTVFKDNKLIHWNVIYVMDMINDKIKKNDLCNSTELTLNTDTFCPICQDIPDGVKIKICNYHIYCYDCLVSANQHKIVKGCLICYSTVNVKDIIIYSE